MTARTFRKKPTEVQALQWRGDNADEVVAFAGHDFEAFTEPCDDDPEATAALMSAPHSTWELVYTGDWIVRHGDGLFTCWRDDEFRETFEPVEAAPVVTSTPTNPGIAASVVITGPTQPPGSYYGALLEYMARCQRQHGGLR